MQEIISDAVEQAETYADLVDIARKVEEVFDVRVTDIYEGNECYFFRTLPLWPDRIEAIESEMRYYAARPSCPQRVDVQRAGKRIWLRFSPR